MSRIVQRARPYAYFLLSVLTIVQVLNFLDRTIISVLAEAIKSTLGIDDASLGVLYGTTFAVFYALFGIPLARLADTWSRKKILGWGLMLWSVMTTLAAFANSFGQLVIIRAGLGIGESAAAPASVSMIADSFSQKSRGTALGIWSTGIYVGAGMGLAVGGLAIATYHKWYPQGNAPFGIFDWQLAMLFAGVPGILLALIVFMLREPKRGLMDGLTEEQHVKSSRPLQFLVNELSSTVPPFTLFALYQLDRTKKVLSRNILYAVMLITFASLMTVLVGSPVQWFGFSLGLYALLSWLQRLAIVDQQNFDAIFKNKALLYTMCYAACGGFLAYGNGFWFTPYIIRRFNVGAHEVGPIIGGIVFITGILGISMGGVISDIWKRFSPFGRVNLCILSVLNIPFGFGAWLSHDLSFVYFCIALNVLIGTSSIPAGLAICSEVSPPRNRATAIALQQFAIILFGLAMGPYTVGLVSDLFGRIGYSSADSLQCSAMLMMIIFPIIFLILAFQSKRYLVEAEKKALQ